ncbi:MAG: dihydropteroate synthase [Xenococcaceae cyanobacterium MO_188.B19]|nr:dihydropteroate synthase [Xenococcaceae cyanobacterium MO_188.B19]
MKNQLSNLVLKRNNFTFNWQEKTYLMGILNVTPDSFSDGGEFNNIQSALKQAKYMINNGADIIDIGGQSTRPGSEQINLETEINRVIPIIKAIRKNYTLPISIDTTRTIVAEQAIVAGADIINDISGGTFDSEMFSTAAKLEVPIILMHIRGTPKTMQQMTDYQDFIGEILSFFNTQINQAVNAGIEKDNIIIDPGIGFAKNPQQNIELLKRLSEFKIIELPLLVGASRKSFIGHILNKTDPKERVWGTAATCCKAIEQGANILRVHDVPEMYDVIRVADALK